MPGIHRQGVAGRVWTLVAAVNVTLALSAAVGTDRAEVAPGPSFTNPVVPAPNSADPTLVYHNGFYYYVASTWS